MGEINDTLCDYFNIPEHSADFWNGTEFWQKEPVMASRLIRCDREYYRKRRREGKSTSMRRDVLMHHDYKPDILLGMELMSTIDYTIPVRVMDYEAQEMKRQLRDISRKNWQNAKGKKGYWAHSGEFLSGVRKSDRIRPVYTVALYCGMEDYDGAEDVLGLLNQDSKALAVSLTSYPVKIYSLKNLPEERFQTSLREIVAVFKRSSDREAVLEYYNLHKERLQQLDELSIRAMGVLIGRKDLNLFPQEEGGLDMCKAFQDAIEEGRVKGHAEGRVEAIKSLMVNLKFTAEQAMDALSIPKSEQEKYLSLI